MSMVSTIAPFALAAVLWGAVASAGDDCSCQPGGSGSDAAKLVRAAVTVCTTSADKDRDTRLEIWISKTGDKETAYLDVGRKTKLVNGSSKVFVVPKTGTPMTRGEIPGSSLQLRITPIGHDSWRFKAKTVLKFNDGTTYQKCFDEAALNREARTGVYKLD